MGQPGDSITVRDFLSNGDAVRRLYRQSLLDLGFSPDTHIYDLPEEKILRAPQTASKLFLSLVLEIYSWLNPYDKALFVNDCLEKGRHPNYWWVFYVSKSTRYRYGKRELLTVREGNDDD